MALPGMGRPGNPAAARSGQRRRRQVERYTEVAAPHQRTAVTRPELSVPRELIRGTFPLRQQDTFVKLEG